MEHALQGDDVWAALYQSLDFGGPGRWSCLHRACGQRASCWAGIDQRLPADDPASSAIARPWVGHGYHELRLVIVGINMNEHGGFNATVQLVQDARPDLARGVRRIRFCNKPSEYRGTLLFHRAGAYAALYAARAQLIEPDRRSDGFPRSDNVERAFDFVAMTNQIKCSPTGLLSAPTAGMWKACGRHVLAQELRLLRPTSILVLGAQNREHLAVNCLDHGQPSWTPRGKTPIFETVGLIAGDPVHVVGVPHPQARGYDVRAVLDDLATVLAFRG